MERLGSNRPSGFSATVVRTWGLIFLAAGAISRGLLQTQLLGLGQLSGEQLLANLSNSQDAMLIATISLVLQAMEACAVPLFALLTVEGFRHTSDFKQYLIRVLGLAVLSELPYNLAISGKLLDLGTRNPAFGVAVSLIALYFFSRYPGKEIKNLLMKLLIGLAAAIWCGMLKIQEGECLLLMVIVLWAFRDKPLYRNFAGATAAVVCTLSSYFYLAAPMVFLVINKYNGEQGNFDRKTNYLAYPVILLAVAAVGIFLL